MRNPANDNAPLTELAHVLKWHTLTYRAKVDAFEQAIAEREARILRELTTIGRA